MTFQIKFKLIVIPGLPFSFSMADGGSNMPKILGLDNAHFMGTFGEEQLLRRVVVELASKKSCFVKNSNILYTENHLQWFEVSTLFDTLRTLLKINALFMVVIHNPRASNVGGQKKKIFLSEESFHLDN